MRKEEIFSYLRTNPLFKNVDESIFKELAESSEVIPIPKGSFLLREGESSKELFLLVEGSCEVLKKSEDDSLLQISLINRGEAIGEMALLEPCNRSASVRTLEDSEFIKIPLDVLKIRSEIACNLAVQLSHRLRDTNEITVKSLQAELEEVKLRIETGRFIVLIFVILSGWILFLSVIKTLTAHVIHSTIITLPIIVILLWLFIYHVKNSSLPKAFFGLTTHNWKAVIVEAVLYSLPVLAIATLAKWALITFDPRFQDLPLFPIPNKLSVLLAIGYTLFTPVQEFIARGVLQTSTEAVLDGRRKIVRSIFLASLIFAAFHAHLSTVFILVAFASGYYWGILFARQRSLIGVSVSHALIGAYCLGILRLATIFRHIG